jgi:hypothetical protein
VRRKPIGSAQAPACAPPPNKGRWRPPGTAVHTAGAQGRVPAGLGSGCPHQLQNAAACRPNIRVHNGGKQHTQCSPCPSLRGRCCNRKQRCRQLNSLPALFTRRDNCWHFLCTHASCMLSLTGWRARVAQLSCMHILATCFLPPLMPAHLASLLHFLLCSRIRSLQALSGPAARAGN